MEESCKVRRKVMNCSHDFVQETFVVDLLTYWAHSVDHYT